MINDQLFGFSLFSGMDVDIGTHRTKIPASTGYNCGGFLAILVAMLMVRETNGQATPSCGSAPGKRDSLIQIIRAPLLMDRLAGRAIIQEEFNISYA